MKCEACHQGDHATCGLQFWCDCEDERDGDPDAEPDVSEVVDDDDSWRYDGGWL